MSAAARGKRCVCGRSGRLPLCDGSHAAEGWTCSRPELDVQPFAFVASPSLRSLADRLAHRFGGSSLRRAGEGLACERLVIVSDGHEVEALQALCAGIQRQEALVLAVGIPAAALQWAFGGAAVAAVDGESSALLWSQAEAAVHGRPSPLPVSEPPSVFLSHAVQDEPRLLPAIDALRDHFGVEVFVCADSIPPGSSWHDAIREQLEACDLVVFVASQAANQSVFCAFEAGLALAGGKPLHIVSLDGHRPPSHLQHLQALDVARLQQRKPWLTSDDALLEACLQSLLV